MDFDKILFMHWYIWSMLWLIHIIFPNFSTELLPLIDFRIMFMLNIMWNNWWIWSNLIATLIFFYAKTCTTTKISTVAGYHVVLAMLLFEWHCSVLCDECFLFQIYKLFHYKGTGSRPTWSVGCAVGLEFRRSRVRSSVQPHIFHRDMVMK